MSSIIMIRSFLYSKTVAVPPDSIDNLVCAVREWSIECINDELELQMFDHQTDLLIRLGRDMSNVLIDYGKKLLEDNKPDLVLKYFQYAYSLADKAFGHGKPVTTSDTHQPSTKYRQILDELIKKAQQSM
ncbi:hypothetical protein I4U23_016214 [Adineta vaga]|nr:hypothetical protein I4U23_016214 [Adineta vaga]